METTIERTPDAARHVRADVFVFGLSFWNATYEELRSWWNDNLEGEGRKGAVLAFANAHTLNTAASNPAFRKALEAADVRVNDGIGFRIASRMRGVETRANLNGTDLLPRLLADAKRPVRVFLYGATEESNAAAADVLQKEFPNVRLAGRQHGYVEADEAEAAIRASSADVVLVALGHPHQEAFCVERRDRVDAKIIVPVGGLIDFLSKTKPRAPEFLRKTGLEWTYRLAIEPRRMFVRYVVGNPIFLVRSAVSARRDRALLARVR